jgi:hypothetical protein
MKDLVGRNPPRSGTLGLAVTTQKQAHGRRHEDSGDDGDAEKSKKDHA